LNVELKRGETIMKKPKETVLVECVGGPLDGHRARFPVCGELEYRTFLFKQKDPSSGVVTADAYAWRGGLRTCHMALALTFVVRVAHGLPRGKEEAQ
jgi:hypothetical protein